MRKVKIDNDFDLLDQRDDIVIQCCNGSSINYRCNTKCAAYSEGLSSHTTPSVVIAKCNAFNFTIGEL